MRKFLLPILFLAISYYAFSSDIVWKKEGFLSKSFTSAMSDDNRFLAVGYFGNHNIYKVWDLQTNTSVFEKSDNVEWTQTFTLSHDGKLLAYYHSEDSRLRVIDMQTNATVYDDTLMIYPTVAKFTSDSKSIIMYGWAGSDFNGYAKLDLATGNKTYYSVPKADIYYSAEDDFALSRDDKYLISAMHKHNSVYWDTSLVEQVILLDLQNGEVKRLLGHRTRVTAFTFTPDSKKAITISNPIVEENPDPRTNFEGSTITWDVETGNIISNVHASKDTPFWNYPVTDLIFNNDGSQLIQYSLYKFAKYYEYPSMNMVRLANLDGSLLGIFLMENNDLIYTTNNKLQKYIYMSDTIIELTDLRIYNGNMHTNEITKIAVSPDDNIVATSSEDNLIKLWDAANGNYLINLEYDLSPVYAIDFSPDGSKLASVSGFPNKKLVVWNMYTHKPLYEVDVFNSTLLAVAFSPMGAKIAVGGYDDSVYIFNASTGDMLLNWNAGQWITALAFSPDGRYLVTSSESEGVRIWDAETGEPALEEILEGQGMNNVKDLHFSDDGSLLALACFDGYVRVVETQDWSIVSTYESRTEHNNVHISMATIMSVCFSPDKKYLYAILGSSNLVKAWDVATGAVAHIYDELYDPYSSASMSSIAVSWDSRYLYSSTDEGTLIKWKNPFFVSVPVKKEESFQVFPNPAGGYICITGIDTIEVMQIYDAGGKLVSEINNPNPEYISLEGIGSGSYYLKIKANSKTEECNLKIIK